MTQPLPLGPLPARSERLLEEFPASTGAYLGAMAEDAFYYSPGPSLSRYAELTRALNPDAVAEADRQHAAEDPFYVEIERPDYGPLIERDAARERVKAAGVNLDIPESGLHERALNILIERKRNEMRRNSILARRPGGVGTMVAGFTVGVGASMFDPLNVASAFVPVVPAARNAMWLSRAGGALGRAGVRARVGAIEGAVGAAALEPLTYIAAQAEQADYDLTDSLLNVAFGTALGGGLHMGAGALGDALSRGSTQPLRDARPQEGLPEQLKNLPPQQREEALRASVAQAINDQRIDIGPLGTRMPEPGEDVAAPLSPEAAQRQALDEVRTEIEGELTARLADDIPTEREARGLRAEITHLREQNEALDGTFGERAKRIQQEEKRTTRKQAEAKARKEIAAERKRIEKRLGEAEARLGARENARPVRADLERLQRGEVPAEFAERVQARAEQILGANARGAAVRNALGDWRADLDATARRQARPEADDSADFDALGEVEARLDAARTVEKPEDLDPEIGEMEAEMRDLEQELGVESDAEVDAARAEVARTEDLGNALRAAVACTLRRAA